ncbi:uncharacterized protein LOC131628372 isoform X4 [Vicia villosa]|uniref:uncharacterized protein LOC131628372 isoform X4 n=1 Tax=Vicia villosa TaxID=3911 RepID=UPI00273B95ED|nr:uncharacterized protein LOC131628372 isoform X4 [Vicia villosa]
MALVPKFVSVMIIFIFIFFVASNIEAKRYTCIQDSDCSVLFCSKSGKSYKAVWGVIANWCEMKILNNDYGWKNLLFWCGLFKGEKVKKWNESIMWMAVCWGLWRSRNEILFEEGILCVLDLVWNIKLALK